MNYLKNGSHFFIQLLCAFLIVSLVTILLSACSTQPSQNPIELTLLPSPTLPPFDAAALQLEQGKYNRDAYCSRVFDYHKTTYGSLTIAIAENFVEPQDQQELAAKVIDRYSDLYNESLVPLSRPLTVYIIPDPSNGGCDSREDLVFTAPDELESRSFIEGMLGAATGINEYWVKSGLASLALGEKPDEEALKTWYQNTDDLDIAGLFIARFNEDWASEEEIQIARMSAVSLLQYALEVEKIQPESLVEKMNNDVRTRWLGSLGVDRKVTYPYDGRLTQFTYSTSSDCSLIAQADSMRFCLNRLPDDEYIDEIPEAEFLMDYAYYGRKTLEDYILAEAPSVNQLMDPKEMITFEVRDLQTRLGYTKDNTIVLNMSAVYYYPLHEIIHTFNWNSLLWHKSAWLNEGFAEYLGKHLAIYQQTEKSCVFEDLNGHIHEEEMSIAPGKSYCYFLDSEQFAAAKAWYLAQGGQMENEESTDPRLYADAVAFATMYRNAYGGSRGIPIGEKYKDLSIRINLDGQDGLELSYTQAASFIGWLCDTYSIDRVLDVYVNHAEDGKLDGKNYAELKSAWQAVLLVKGQGIEIPGTP